MATTWDDVVAFASTLPEVAALVQGDDPAYYTTPHNDGHDYVLVDLDRADAGQVAEECEVYRECGEYTKTYGTRLIEIEYTDTPRSAYTRACAARSGKASILLRDRDVVPAGDRGYVYRHC